MKKTFAIILLALVATLSAGCQQAQIGGERDEHGCLTAAGYAYDDTVDACIREWELDESDKRAAGAAVDYRGAEQGLAVVDVEAQECEGCYSITLQKEDEREVVALENWEVQEGAAQEEFCGSSTYASCQSDADCIEAGCSGSICQGADEEQMVTTCEYRECYNNEQYGLECGCMNNQCQWH